jgi:hypothetical protein
MISPYQIPVTCSVCGEAGNASVFDRGNEWLGDKFRHIDGHHCAEVLKRKLADLERKS